MPRQLRTPLFMLSLAVSTGLLAPVATAQESTVDGGGDATVIAVIDDAMNPYHWDFLASKMPQANDEDPSNDLPLSEAPHTWLPGFPDPSTFAGYSSLDLTLEEESRSRSAASLRTVDASKWNAVKPSTSGVNYYWIPRTKVIGALTFSTSGKISNSPPRGHGTGTTSVSVGNTYGTCPECLLVFIQYSGAENGERAIEWAESQPWIDAISNSYGFSAVERDRLYSGSDVAAQRAASERGQTIFFSAGNGMTNTFTIPNSTLFSSQEGPDWIVTVGGITPGSGSSFSGHGKPADISGVGTGYPSSYNATGVGASGANFGGTSNATPTIAGTYGKALYLARRDLAGVSRIQQEGIVAQGDPYPCGATRPECELGDGLLTAGELRTRLFHGAVRTAPGMNVGGLPPDLPPIGEDELLNEGYGSYFGLVKGEAAWQAELDRIMGPLEGRTSPLARPAGEREWMVVDSYCRQELWGDWTGGSYVRGQTTLPGPSAQFPVRSAMELTCPHLFPPL